MYSFCIFMSETTYHPFLLLNVLKNLEQIVYWWGLSWIITHLLDDLFH